MSYGNERKVKFSLVVRLYNVFISTYQVLPSTGQHKFISTLTEKLTKCTHQLMVSITDTIQVCSIITV
jgi:hypothetical protein